MDYAIKKILVPIDFSPNADNALRIAVAMAKRHGAAIHLLNVVPVYTLSPALQVASNMDKQLDLLIKAGQEHLDNYKKDIEREHQLTVTATAEFGAVYGNICNYVVVNHINLVVMGTHGISGWEEFLIGSTAMAVIKECRCPVLTIPHTFLKSGFENVLYPVRNTAGMAEKYQYIRSITEKNNSAIHLLGLIQKNEANNSDLVDQMKKVVDVILDDHDVITYEINYCQNIADKILETAAAREDDLIVIHATLDTDWKEFFSGSYTQQIINHAHVPVLALKF